VHVWETNKTTFVVQILPLRGGTQAAHVTVMSHTYMVLISIRAFVRVRFQLQKIVDLRCLNVKNML